MNCPDSWCSSVVGGSVRPSQSCHFWRANQGECSHLHHHHQQKERFDVPPDHAELEYCMHIIKYYMIQYSTVWQKFDTQNRKSCLDVFWKGQIISLGQNHLKKKTSKQVGFRFWVLHLYINAYCTVMLGQEWINQVPGKGGEKKRMHSVHTHVPGVLLFSPLLASLRAEQHQKIYAYSRDALESEWKAPCRKKNIREFRK